MTPDLSCCRIIDLTDGEEIIFCRDPWVVSNSVPQYMFDISEKMRKSTPSPSEYLSSMSELCDFPAHMDRRTKS